MAKTRSYTGLITLVIIAAAAGGGWYYWQGHRQKGPEYYTTNANKGEIVQTVTAAGTIKPLLDVLVSSQISGYITAWYTDFNAKVKKGDLLATLLPNSYQAAVQSAQGDLANAKANSDLQKVTLARDKELLAKNLLAQSDFDTQAALVAESEAQIQIKQASLDTAQTNLAYCRIVSPMDGMVISRNIDVGNSVAATLSSPTLFEIANDLTQMQIDSSVAEADVGNVEVGQDVNFSVDAYPNRQFHGKVYQVRNAPQTQQNVVIYDVMIKVDNADLKLKPGMTANVSIVITRRPDVLRLANSGLRFRLPDGLAVIAAPAPVPAGGAAAAAPAKTLTPDERRKQMSQLMQDAGYTRGSGPPTPEIIAKIKQLRLRTRHRCPRALSWRRPVGRGRRCARIYRTIYRLPPGNPPGSKPEELRVQIGITDGANTEILGGGLKDGDTIVTGVNLPSAGPGGGASSPFGGGGRGGGFGR